jgi:aconitate hydratase
MLALTFVQPSDYDLVRQDDHVDILGFENFNPDSQIRIRLRHADGTSDTFDVMHGYNEQQAEWVKAGSALNKIRQDLKRK